MLDIFPKITIVFFTQLFCNIVCNYCLFVPFTFSDGKLKFTSRQFHHSKTSPCLCLPSSLHIRYACRAAQWSSFTCSFQPGTMSYICGAVKKVSPTVLTNYAKFLLVTNECSRHKITLFTNKILGLRTT